MGNTKIKAANDLQKLANTFRGLLDLADELSDVGSLEQAGEEAAQHLHDLKNQIEEKEAYFAKLLKDKQAELDATVAKAGFLILDAKKEAQEITRNAANGAAVMLDNAHKEVKKVKDDSQKEAAKASLELSNIKTQSDIAKVELMSMERDIDQRKREHSGILKMIADLKAKF